MDNSIDMKSLVGKHVLTGVDEENRKIEHWGDLEDCQCINFVLDGITYTAIEDPDDGYRSSLDGIIVSLDKVRNNFPPVEVIVSYRTKGESDWDDGNECDILDVVDVKSGKRVLEIGTDNTDDYYPCFVANFTPENFYYNQTQ